MESSSNSEPVAVVRARVACVNGIARRPVVSNDTRHLTLLDAGPAFEGSADD